MHLLLFFLFFNFSSAQTPKLIIGDCLEDSPSQLATHYIDHDSTGIYFIKKGKNTENSNYIEKYDSKSLKKVYKCILPKIFNDNVIKTFYFNERQYFVILKDKKLDLIFTNLDGNNIDFYTLRIDENGKCADLITKIYTLPFNNKTKKKEVYIKLSPQKKYLCVYNLEEEKNANVITNFKIDLSDKLTITKLFDYTLKETKTESLHCLDNVYDDGRIGSFYRVDDKVRVAMVDISNKLYSKDLTEIIKEDVEIDKYSAEDRMLVNESENVITVYNKKTKKYGFVLLKYDHAKKEYKNTGLTYIDNQNTQRLEGKLKGYDDFEREGFTHRETIKNGDNSYKIISRGYIITHNMSLDAQGYLSVLNFDESNKLISQKIVPFQLYDYVLANDMHVNGDMYNQVENKNYATILKNGELYVFTNENKKNEFFDAGKGLIKDFEDCKNINESNYCCYKIASDGKIIKTVVASNKNDNFVYNVINNYNHIGNYQYVYIKIKTKKTLGKISID